MIYKEKELVQASATYSTRAGCGPCPFTDFRNCMARLVALHIMNLPSLQLLVMHASEKMFMINRTVL